jgi:molecular chaperone GrpE (heat shock protein)
MEMEEDDSSTGFSPEVRERIIRSFEAWLDRSIADEQPPQGLTAGLLAALENGDPLPPLESEQTGSRGCDFYSLWAAMTALTQEVRLQGRTFKQLNETLNRSAQSLEASAAETRGGREDAPAEQSRIHQVEAGQPRKQEIHFPLNVLLDLRDRVERGGNTARNAAEELTPKRLPQLARWLGVSARYVGHTQEILAALSHGCSLTLDSLDEVLVDSSVSRIACQGQIFDPQRMTAVDIEETSSVPEGTVVEVYRNGYEWNGEVYRTAQVKVARTPERKSA